MIRFLGIFGLVLLGFGIISGFIIGSFTVELVLAHVGIGALSIVLWGLFVGSKSMGEARHVIRGRTTRYGFNAFIYTLICIGIIASLNWIVHRHNQRWDLTEQKVYSLSPQSQTLMKELKMPLSLVGFKGVSEDEAKLQEMLQRYKDSNPGNISLEIIDPRAKPHLWTKYGMKPGNQIYIGYGEGAQKTVSRINESTEQAITNAVLKLTRGAAKKVYFVHGHGEPSSENAKADGISQAVAALKDEHLTPEPLLLGQVGQVPSDAAAVILVAPQTPLRPEEKKALITYGEQGGRLLLFAEPRTSGDITEIAAAFGIKVGADIIVDQVQKLLTGPELGFEILAFDYDKINPITKDFTQQNATVFNTASSVTKLDTGISGGEYWPLVKSSAYGWAENDLASVFDQEQATVRKDSNDTAGPVSLAVAYEKKLADAPDKKDETMPQRVTRVVVFGDSSWIWNASFRYDASRNLFLNAVNWVSGEEGGVTIRPGEMKASQNPIPQQTLLQIFLTSLLGPELLLLMGLWVWWRRRALTATAS